MTKFLILQKHTNEKTDFNPSRREPMEQVEPVYRLDQRGSFRERHPGGHRGRQGAEGERLQT